MCICQVLDATKNVIFDLLWTHQNAWWFVLQFWLRKSEKGIYVSGLIFTYNRYSVLKSKKTFLMVSWCQLHDADNETTGFFPIAFLWSDTSMLCNIEKVIITLFWFFFDQKKEKVILWNVCILWLKAIDSLYNLGRN